MHKSSRFPRHYYRCIDLNKKETHSSYVKENLLYSLYGSLEESTSKNQGSDSVVKNQLRNFLKYALKQISVNCGKKRCSVVFLKLLCMRSMDVNHMLVS